MAQFQDDSKSDSERVVFEMPKHAISSAAIDAFGNADGESEKFFRSLLYQLYRHSPTSRKDFEKDMKEIFEDVLNQADRFHLHYGGNSGDSWRQRKYPGKKWDWDWESKIPKSKKETDL